MSATTPPMDETQNNKLSRYIGDGQRVARAFANASGHGATLIDSAVRLLSAAAANSDRRPHEEEAATFIAPDTSVPIHDQLWELTFGVTMLSVQGDVPSSIYEAAAALQEFACLFAEQPAAEVMAKVSALREL